MQGNAHGIEAQAERGDEGEAYLFDLEPLP